MLVPLDTMAFASGATPHRDVLQPVDQLLQYVDHLVGDSLRHLRSLGRLLRSSGDFELWLVSLGPGSTADPLPAKERSLAGCVVLTSAPAWQLRRSLAL